MARKIKQFRFYQRVGTNGDTRNQPAEISLSNLKSGAIFSTSYPIVQLGIQTLPGVKFYLNKAIDPIMIGETGIYDLELDGTTQITHLCFDGTSLNLINSNPDAYLIIDIIYESEGV